MDRKEAILLLLKPLFISEPASRAQTKTVVFHKPPGSCFLVWQTKALRIIYIIRYTAVINKDARQRYFSKQHNTKHYFEVYVICAVCFMSFKATYVFFSCSKSSQTSCLSTAARSVTRNDLKSLSALTSPKFYCCTF